MATLSLKIRRKRAIVAVEMALLLPLLLMLVLGAIEYGWLFLKSQQVTNAARCGARQAVRYGSTTAGVQQSVKDLLLNTGLGTPNIVITPSDVSSPYPGSPVVVQVTAGYSPLMGLPFLPVPSQLTSSVTMAKEGP